MNRFTIAVFFFAIIAALSAVFAASGQDIPSPVTHGEDGIAPVPLSPGERISARIAPCVDDGVSGKRYQVVYLYPSEGSSRYNEQLNNFRIWAGGVSDIISATSRQTGPTRVLRFVTENCQITVLEKALPTATLQDFWSIHQEMKRLGLTNSNRNVLAFVDNRTICGEGSLWLDDSPDSSNWHNRGGATAVVGNGCWGANVAAHEVLHNLGAVQGSAPNMTANYHCVDEWDIMCYNDGSATTHVECATGNDDWVDCNNNDYFHSDPPAGSYLDTHWNTANNEFLELYAPPTPVTPTPTPVTPAPVTPTPTPVTPTPTTVPPTVVPPTPTKPRVTISKTTVKIGDRVTIKGTNHVPGDYVVIWWDGKRYLGGVRVASDGSFSRTVTIPRDIAGEHKITIKTQEKNYRAMMNLVV